MRDIARSPVSNAIFASLIISSIVGSIQFNLENRFFRLLCHQSTSMHSPYANMKKFAPQYSRIKGPLLNPLATAANW